MELSDRVLEFAGRYDLLGCDAVIAGCSGGPDSMALLDILHEAGIRLYCVHINHNLRPGDCDRDEALVSDYCRDRDIPFVSYSFDVASLAARDGISEETEGRKLRYKAFEEAADRIASEEGLADVRIAVAHHKDDVAETMMMNMFRGSGLEGLVSPAPRSGRVVRPLLSCRKSELISYLDGKGIPYATDYTNSEACCTRNEWRNVIFPDIETETGRNPVEALNRTYGLLAEDLDYINRAAEEAYAVSTVTVGQYKALSVSALNALHPAICSRLIRRLWLETFGNLTDFEQVNLEACIDLAGADAQGGATVLDMPFARKAVRYEDYLCFLGSGDDSERLFCLIAEKMGLLTCAGALDVEIRPGIALNLPDSDISLKALIIENNNELEYNNYSWFCPEEILTEGRVTLTCGRAGGLKFKFTRAGSGSGKELRRFFTDLKVPADARDSVIFVRQGDRVLWIPGAGHAEGFTGKQSKEKFEGSGRTAGRLLKITLERQASQ